jgi:hypothetical protein
VFILTHPRHTLARLPGPLLDTMDVVRGRVDEADKQIDRLEAELKQATAALTVERAARESAERARDAAISKRVELERVLVAERAAHASDIAQREARHMTLLTEARKHTQARVEAASSVATWGTAQAEINQRMAALLKQHRLEMSHLQLRV